MMKTAERVLIVSAHADDETFGMGGTILKLKEQGREIFWLIATRPWEPKWSSQQCALRERDIQSVCAQYNFKEVVRWDYRDNMLDTCPKNELQEKMIGLMDRIQPGIVFVPGPWDFNFEHRLIFEVVEMATKPFYSCSIRQIYAYEIPSSTDGAFKSIRNFVPNTYEDIGPYLERKKKNCALYTTELKEYPHPRSLQAVEALSRVRGMEAGLAHAEAFHLLRSIHRCA